MIEPDSSSTATFETHASIIARNKSSGEPPVSVRTGVCFAALENIAAVHFPSDAKRHGLLFTEYQPISLHGCLCAKSRLLSNRCSGRLTPLSPLAELQSRSIEDNCSNLFLFPIR